MQTVEIERKFLVSNDLWKKEKPLLSFIISQIYLTKNLGFKCYFQLINEERIALILEKDNKKFDEIFLDENQIKQLYNDKSFNIKDGDFLIDETKKWSIRLRKQTDIMFYDSKAELTVKGPSVGLTRTELNFSIDVGMASIMLLNLEECDAPLISKQRTVLQHDNNTVWEIDQFVLPKSVKGLVLAEIEIPYEDYPINYPVWLGEDVSCEPQYYNSNLK